MLSTAQIIPLTKLCGGCGLEKEIAMFPKRYDGTADGVAARCSRCVNSYKRERNKRLSPEQKRRKRSTFYDHISDADLREKGLLRTCNICNTEKPLTDFYANRHSAFGRSYRCKMCSHESALQRSPNYKTQRRAYQLKVRYGMSIETYEALLSSQGSKCAICRSHFKSDRQTFVDHCHGTDKVRGLLCASCNSGIGHLQDSADILRNAVRYLEERSVKDA